MEIVQQPEECSDTHEMATLLRLYADNSKSLPAVVGIVKALEITKTIGDVIAKYRIEF